MQCERCHQTFSKRSAYEAHQARVRPCTILQEVQEVHTVVPLKPVIKWVGGKTQILDTLLTRFPRHMADYHEPFLGGGSVLLGLLAHRASGAITVTGTVYASDINPFLIGLYQSLQQNPDALLAELRILMQDFSQCREEEVNRAASTKEEALGNKESYYYWIRSQFNQMEEKCQPRGSAHLLFLNKTCFRGVYREGPRGFNVPYGNHANPGIFDEVHLRAVSQQIQPVVFRVQSFSDALSSVQPDDFVYLDPPYAPESATSFVSYTANGFDADQHAALFARCHDLQGVRWLMSNAAVPLVRDAFPPPYSTTVLSCRRAIHSKKPDSKTEEVLIASPQGFA